MLDRYLDPEEENDKLGDAYIEWLESNYSGPQIDDGNCPSYEEWLETQEDFQKDNEQEVS